MRTPQQIATDIAADVRAAAADEEAATLREAFGLKLQTLRVRKTEVDAWQDGCDVLGTAYERLLTGEQRRSLGQFYTPLWAGEVMAQWIFNEQIELVLDPGCGSGALLIAAARNEKRGKARLLGIDRDPLAVAMVEKNARIRRFGDASFRTGDFLLDELREQPDAVICNPPYSRHHSIPAVEKAAIHKGFTDRIGARFNRLAALHALFLMRALEVSAADARIAFITPSDWLDVGYGAQFKQELLKSAQIESLILLDGDHLFFGSSVLTTAAITLIKKGRPNTEPTNVVRLTDSLPTPTDVLASLEGCGPVATQQVRLGVDRKWSRPAYRRPRGVPLGDIARIRRGIATGSNSFFTLSEKTRVSRAIPLDQLRPCTTSPRAVLTNELRMEDLDALPLTARRWVLDCRDPDEEGADTAMGRYLRWGKRTMRAHKGYLAEHREPWYALEVRGDSPILFSYFNRERPRFIRNHARAVPLNTWLIVEPAEGVDADELYAALTSTAATRQLTMGARVYGGGLWKLEPSELAQIVLPASLRPR